MNLPSSILQDLPNHGVYHAHDKYGIHNLCFSEASWQPDWSSCLLVSPVLGLALHLALLCLRLLLKLRWLRLYSDLCRLEHLRLLVPPWSRGLYDMMPCKSLAIDDIKIFYNVGSGTAQEKRDLYLCLRPSYAFQATGSVAAEFGGNLWLCPVWTRGRFDLFNHPSKQWKGSVGQNWGAETWQNTDKPKVQKGSKVTCLRDLLALSRLDHFFLRCKQGTLRPQSYATNKLPGELEKDVISWSASLPDLWLTKVTKTVLDVSMTWACLCIGHALDLVPASSALARCTAYIMVTCITKELSRPVANATAGTGWSMDAWKPAGAMRLCSWQEEPSAFEVWITLFRSFPFSS